jgi:hypothetical protein
MSNFVIEIKAPELVQAVNNLADVLLQALGAKQTEGRVNLASVPSKPAPESTESTPAPKTTPEKVVTLEEVRAKLAELTKIGKREQVQGLLGRYGVQKLTEVPADKYPELLQLAEAI